MLPTAERELSMNALFNELDDRNFFFLTGQVVHNSRQAALVAQEAVLNALHQLHPTIEPSAWSQRWNELALERASGTCHAWTHSEHARSWLRALVRGFGICLNVPETEHLVATHRKAYKEVLAPHPWSHGLIDALITSGKEIIYLSEGWFDMQPWIMTELGLHGRSGSITARTKGTEACESLAAEACKATKAWPQEIVLVLDEAAAKTSKAELDRRKRTEEDEDEADRVLVQLPRVSGCEWVSTHRTSRAALAALLKLSQDRRSLQAGSDDSDDCDEEAVSAE